MEASETVKHIEIALRIEKVMRHYSRSTEEFIEKMDIHQDQFESIMKSDDLISLAFIQKICSQFPELNARWLLLGEGAYLVEKPKEIFATSKLKINIIVEDITIPLLIERTDEEIYRAAGKCLKDKLSACKLENPGIDIQRAFRNVGFSFAVKFVRNTHSADSTKLEEPKNLCPNRQAAINYNEQKKVFRFKYPLIENLKLFALVAYQFAVMTQRWK